MKAEAEKRKCSSPPSPQRGRSVSRGREIGKIAADHPIIMVTNFYVCLDCGHINKISL